MQLSLSLISFFYLLCNTIYFNRATLLKPKTSIFFYFLINDFIYNEVNCSKTYDYSSVVQKKVKSKKLCFQKALKKAIYYEGKEMC